MRYIRPIDTAGVTTVGPKGRRLYSEKAIAGLRACGTFWTVDFEIVSSESTRVAQAAPKDAVISFSNAFNEYRTEVMVL